MAVRRRIARICVLVALVALGMAPSHVRAEEALPLEYKVKAAFLHRFLKFVTWPDANLPAAGEPLVVGVAGDTPMARALRAIREGSVQGREIVVREIAAPEELAGCQAAYLPDDALLPSLAGRPVLTVGESADFLAAGGVIRFLIDNDRIRFAIDADNAQAVDLQISSNLLRLSHKSGE